MSHTYPTEEGPVGSGSGTPGPTPSSHYQDSKTYLGDSACYLIGGLDVLVAVPCMLLNVAIFCFYRSKLHRIVPLSFACLALR